MNTQKENLLKPSDEEYFDILRVKSFCWRCSFPIELITYHSQVDGLDNYLGSFPFLDEILLTKYPEYLTKRMSKTQNSIVISNLCRKCDTIQGNFFQWELWDGRAEDNEEFRFLETISVKLSDLFSKEELDLINNQEDF